MTLPRFRNRQQQGRETGSSAAAAAAAAPPSRSKRTARAEESGWPAPWMPWAVGIGLVLAGALAAFFSLYILARPVMNHMPAVKGADAAPAQNRAEVLGPEPTANVAPGDQVELTWDVQNTGQSEWHAYDYRFAPGEGVEGPVISLQPTAEQPSDPKVVRPGDTVTVHVRVTAPAAAGTWRPAWDLIGPGGKVAGGRLTALVSVTDGTEP